MTVQAIRVYGKLGGTILVSIGIGLRRIVLVFVMSEMLRRLLFVLAIRSRRGPGELDRQHYQQENENEFFHVGNHIIKNGNSLAIAQTLRAFPESNGNNAASITPWAPAI